MGSMVLGNETLIFMEAESLNGGAEYELHYKVYTNVPTIRQTEDDVAEDMQLPRLVEYGNYEYTSIYDGVFLEETEEFLYTLEKSMAGQDVFDSFRHGPLVANTDRLMALISHKISLLDPLGDSTQGLKYISLIELVQGALVSSKEWSDR